jgi:hypothetical protein
MRLTEVEATHDAEKALPTASLSEEVQALHQLAVDGRRVRDPILSNRACRTRGDMPENTSSRSRELDGTPCKRRTSSPSPR